MGKSPQSSRGAVQHAKRDASYRAAGANGNHAVAALGGCGRGQAQSGIGRSLVRNVHVDPNVVARRDVVEHKRTIARGDHRGFRVLVPYAILVGIDKDADAAQARIAHVASTIRVEIIEYDAHDPTLGARRRVGRKALVGAVSAKLAVASGKLGNDHILHAGARLLELPKGPGSRTPIENVPATVEGTGSVYLPSTSVTTEVSPFS